MDSWPLLHKAVDLPRSRRVSKLWALLITAIHPKWLASKRLFAWSTTCMRASILACDKQQRELNLSGYFKQFESRPPLLTAHTLRVGIISSGPPCPIPKRPLNQNPVKACMMLLDHGWHLIENWAGPQWPPRSIAPSCQAHPTAIGSTA